MHFVSETLLDDVVERHFTDREVPGILWTPSSASASAPVPVILMGHPGGLDGMHPRLVARERQAVSEGFAAATIELPGSGRRPPLPDVDRARADLRRSLAAGERRSEAVVDQLVLPLVERAVPEWRSALDGLLAQPEICAPAGVSGGVTAIGVRLAVEEPRVAALGLFAGSLIPKATLEDARRVTIPVHVLLQWDDEHNDRQRALELFDALGSKEKSLIANMGGHTGVPSHAGEDASRFFSRHLREVPSAATQT